MQKRISPQCLADESAAWSTVRTIPNSRTVAIDLVGELAEAMHAYRWAKDEIEQVRLAFTEASTNAIVHGNRNERNATIEVRLLCNQDRVEIKITDQGLGFDPTQVPDPRSPEHLHVPGGRGVFLMRELMCEVVYGDRGNEVTMKKRRTQRPKKKAWMRQAT